jgi:hypothetical protein
MLWPLFSSTASTILVYEQSFRPVVLQAFRSRYSLTVGRPSENDCVIASLFSIHCSVCSFTINRQTSIRNECRHRGMSTESGESWSFRERIVCFDKTTSQEYGLFVAIHVTTVRWSRNWDTWPLYNSIEVSHQITSDLGIVLQSSSVIHISDFPWHFHSENGQANPFLWVGKGPFLPAEFSEIVSRGKFVVMEDRLFQTVGTSVFCCHQFRRFTLLM